MTLSIAGSQRRERHRGGRREHVDLGGGKTLLEPLNRRQAGDEIADVVELLHEDAAHLVARQQRPAGDDDAGRFGIRRIVGIRRATGAG